jgi:heme exporter protein D
MLIVLGTAVILYVAVSILRAANKHDTILSQALQDRDLEERQRRLDQAREQEHG